MSFTINIGMKAFVRMVENLPWYMEQEIVEVKEKAGCPIGMLGGCQDWIYPLRYI